MQTRKFGQTGLDVSVVGFGAMTIGGAFGPVDDAESTAALHAAIDAGMNFIDTSNAYGEGRSEEIIGRFLKERPDRDDILVFTKGGNNMVTRQRNFEAGYIATCLEESLARLGRTIDFYMLHNPSADNMAAEDSYAVLEKAKDAGKIRHWGVSVNTPQECEFAVKQGRIAGMQMEYNVINQGAADAFEQAHAAGVAVISRVPLSRGLLSGRFSEDHEFAEGDNRRRNLSPENIRKHQGRLDELKAKAAALGISPADLAIRFCVSNPNVSCVIPGIRTVEQAQQNAAAAVELSAQALADLR